MNPQVANKAKSRDTSAKNHLDMNDVATDPHTRIFLFSQGRMATGSHDTFRNRASNLCLKSSCFLTVTLGLLVVARRKRFEQSSFVLLEFVFEGGNFCRGRGDFLRFVFCPSLELVGFLS